MKNKKLFAILTLLCFMFTLMPVAAFAAPAEADMSYFLAADGNQTVTKDEAAAGIEFIATMLDGTENDATTSTVYVWAEDANGTVTSALTVRDYVSATATPAQNAAAKAYDEVDTLDNVIEVKNVAGGESQYNLFFNRAGEYTVYAGFAKAGATVDSLSKINVFGEASKITVIGATVDPEIYQANNVYGYGVVAAGATVASDGIVDNASVKANGVASNKIVVKFTENGKALRGETVTIETNSAAIDASKASAVTNSRGEIDFTVSGTIEGNYEVELVLDGVTWIVTVAVGDTGATYIETAEQPKAALAQFGDLFKSNPLNGTKVRFNITDINGNVVKGTNQTAATAGMGMNGIAGNAASGKYIVLTEKPEASNLTSKKLSLKYSTTDQMWYLDGVGTLDVEGVYSVKVILDNGAKATATWEVKKFQTPVQLRIDTAVSTVALGGYIGADLTYVDANGVEKNAKDAELTATGYAVQNVAGTAVYAKTDEKYVGEKITVTAVSERYNLVATKEYTVVGEAVAVAFVDKAADVNVNNRLTWNLVDEAGNKIAIANAASVDAKYVVLDKPEGAKVSIIDATNYNDLKNKGIGKLSLTSNKVGNVTVQVVVTAEFENAKTVETTQDGTVVNKVVTGKQVKYYTGTQIIAVGTQGVGDVVVMSIGSNEIVINDAKATIDAAPIVENNRTFVPFRALAEAFGATVAYDEATQAVTAELNGVTVVMTIGSAEYTVNGEAKTADVAPFINGSRTMVPVRFAAEAFGIKVIPTYDENGATADILFNL